MCFISTKTGNQDSLSLSEGSRKGRPEPANLLHFLLVSFKVRWKALCLAHNKLLMLIILIHSYGRFKTGHAILEVNLQAPYSEAIQCLAHKIN